ncbi:NAD(P)/FAD-dependent oxidoreductase [uncultured Holdemanella sp.]|uniref:NAD(P)/FAD-dependent oxidoreductase n=1 Tax=uncultured Holdemanella sp. TaxID=1763549 RepID=UPI00265B0C9C|nr:NAD(P)/FAD-dependent oxidoreductase [uncultured Holdemanella sp.]
MLKVCVIGGGPAGLMAAYTARLEGHQVELFEKNKQLGKKLQLTGHGRCNVTNNCSKDEFFKHVVHNEKFLYSPFSQFSNLDMIKFLKSNGLPTIEEDHGRMFPGSNSSQDIVLLFVELLRKNNVILHMDEACTNVVVEENRVVGIKTDKGTYSFDVVIVATGGKSFVSTGSSGDGYKWAEALDIKVSNLYPGLVSLQTREDFDLAGLSLSNVGIQVKKDKKVLYKECGDILFTHEGLSGPGILIMSSYVINKDPKRIILDLIPNKSVDEVDALLLERMSSLSNKQLKHILEMMIPKRLVQYIMNQLNIDVNLKANETTKAQRRSISELLKCLSFEIVNFAGFEQAMVTVGGIKTNQIQPQTMETKKIKGLKFAGEVLDLDAQTGGYNLQIAWTTGYVAGSTLKEGAN